MSKFEESMWADTEFSQRYRSDADYFLPFRSQFIQAAKSLYSHFISDRDKARVLDLGCGDGLFLEKLLKDFSPASVTLVDGSPEMLASARERLLGKQNLRFVHSTFQELMDDDLLGERFDFIYSSLAIHHLSFEEKQRLYAYIYDHLSPGGYFVHYDVVLPPTAELECWYLALWRDWINAYTVQGNSKKFLKIPDQYKSNPDNVPDTLESQLKALEDIRFCNVDCFSKFGIFALFGGSR